ncbi:Flavoprotein Monooxygenase [Ectocarpus siliculosus]|uniref:Flavoprotein Monooxygenase n=1 Tax=Ectocarpus siliculosus TaxID=2880 RepID=D8LE88_ECTSI|nr:Flavoprotein Monooxygenase [Ectocarpus siliculosus]|eukprot:CBN74164.1 Flavoprotein Monooxygenase [Ectocarpus siliculosus]
MTPITKLVGYPFIGISRHALQKVLLGHLEDDDVELGARLERLDTDEGEGITELRFRGQSEVVRARAVIGADGRRSIVRKKVLAAEERNCDWALTWWALADIPEPATPKGEFRMSYSTKQAIYYGEVEEGVTMWSFTCWRDGEIERDPELRAGRALKELEGWPEEVRNVVRNTPPNKIIEVYVGDSPLQWTTWSKQPGVSLMGDAAHSMLPTLAMGVTTALQDAAALTKCIDNADTPLMEALKEYENARRVPSATLQLISRVAMVFIENVLCG